MNTENKDLNKEADKVPNEESRGLNETNRFEESLDTFHNSEMDEIKKEDTDAEAEVERTEDIALEKSSQNSPGSSGAFPVGAFDTTKP